MARIAYVTEHSPVWEKTTYKVEIPDQPPNASDGKPWDFDNEEELREFIMEKVTGGDAEIFFEPEVEKEIDGMDSDYDKPRIEEVANAE